MPDAPRVKFKAKLETTHSDPPWHILRVPKTKVAKFEFKGNLRRVLCSLNGNPKFNCALMPSDGNYFLTVSKKLRDALGIVVGDSVTVELEKDTSKYGMPVPKEFAEVLRQDPDGAKLFNALSPGNQRLMLKLVVFVTNVDKRIARSLAGIELLKRSAGKFDYHAQHLAMKLVTSDTAGFKIDLER